MTTYGAYKVIADAFDLVAEQLAQVAADLRELDEADVTDADEEERRRAAARERTRRYRARRNGDADPRHGDASPSRHGDADDEENSLLGGAPSRATDPREVGRRDDGRPERDASQRDSVTRRDATSRRDAQPASDWRREEPATEAERDLARRKVRELGDQLRATREEGPR